MRKGTPLVHQRVHVSTFETPKPQNYITYISHQQGGHYVKENTEGIFVAATVFFFVDAVGYRIFSTANGMYQRT